MTFKSHAQIDEDSQKYDKMNGHQLNTYFIDEASDYQLNLGVLSERNLENERIDRMKWWSSPGQG